MMSSTIVLAFSLAGPGPVADSSADQPAETPPGHAESEAESESESEPEAGSESESESEAEAEAESESEIVQPGEPEDEPPGAAGAVGGLGHTPLPAPPRRRDPGLLDARPWRGQGWFDVRLDVMIPLAGQRPGRGTAVSVAGGFNLGWRIANSVGVYTGLTTFVHDEEVRRSTRSDGTEVSVQGVGRSVLFDLAVLRLWLPVGRRVQPWADVGGGVGVYRGGFSSSGQVVGHGKVGAGVDFWLAPTFSLGLGTAYRVLAIDRTVGHGLSVGLDVAVHW